MEPMPLAYRPLLFNELRLCRLLREKSVQGLLQLEMQHFRYDLGHDTHVDESLNGNIFNFLENNAPEYTALSYMWGPATPIHRILINGAASEIRDNLQRFLSSAFELEGFGTWFWIDQICINQDDEPERSALVQRMGSIYRRADYVRIWLGERNELTDIAFAAIREHFEDPEDYKNDEGFLDPEIWFEKKLAARPLVPQALAELLLRPYWSRLWIRQEILLARRMCLQCDTALLPSADFDSDINTFSAIMYDIASGIDSIHGGHMLHATMLFGGCYGEASPLLNVLTLYYGRCADPRDRVFALTALVLPEQRVPVDYGMTPEEVFWAVVQATYVTGLCPLLDSDGIRILFQLAKDMHVSDVVDEVQIRTRVEGIYAKNGWDYLPARSEEEAWQRYKQGVYKATESQYRIAIP